jgi:hypothetical protein
MAARLFSKASLDTMKEPSVPFSAETVGDDPSFWTTFYFDLTEDLCVDGVSFRVSLVSLDSFVSLLKSSDVSERGVSRVEAFRVVLRRLRYPIQSYLMWTEMNFCGAYCRCCLALLKDGDLLGDKASIAKVGA